MNWDQYKVEQASGFDHAIGVSTAIILLILIAMTSIIWVPALLLSDFMFWVVRK